MSTALRALAAGGIKGLTLRQVARDHGVSLATVQRHFPTKDQLWTACVDALVPPLPTRGPVSKPVDATSTLTTHLTEQIERALIAPEATATMWNDNEAGSEERLNYLTTVIRPLVEANAALLQSARDSGLVGPVDVEVFLALLGLGVTSMVNAPQALHRLFGLDIEREEGRRRVTAALTQLLLDGLLARTKEISCAT